MAADFDLARLEQQVLEPLFEGRVARYQRYDWERNGLGSTVEVAAGSGAIIEDKYIEVEQPLLHADVIVDGGEQVGLDPAARVSVRRAF